MNASIWWLLCTGRAGESAAEPQIIQQEIITEAENALEGHVTAWSVTVREGIKAGVLLRIPGRADGRTHHVSPSRTNLRGKEGIDDLGFQPSTQHLHALHTVSGCFNPDHRWHCCPIIRLTNYLSNFKNHEILQILLFGNPLMCLHVSFVKQIK